MPEFSLALVSQIGLGLLAGLVLGSVIRTGRNAREKRLVNASWQEQLNAQYAEVERLRDQGAQLLEQVQQHKQAYRDLSERLDSASAGQDKAEAQLLDAMKSNEALHERLATLSRALSAAEQTSAENATELQAWQNRISPLVQKYREKEAKVRLLEQEIQQIRRDLKTIPEPPPQSRTTKPANAPDTAPPPDREDLQLIRGIGPAIEQILHRLGIRNLEQIADFKAEDIHRVAAEIRGFSSRISRENWIEQAKTLLGRK